MDKEEVRLESFCASCPYIKKENRNCCTIYDKKNKHIAEDKKNLPMEDFIEWFHSDRKSYGIDPLYDPIEVHIKQNEDKIKEAKKEGIDIRYCEYFGESGCIIKYENRPKECKKYACNLLKQELKIKK